MQCSNLTKARRSIALAGALLLVLVACSSMSERVYFRSAKPPPNVSFESSLSIGDHNTYRITYEVSNHSSADILVFNGIPRVETDQKPTADPDAVYVTVRDDGGIFGPATVEVSKRLFVVPPHTSVDAPWRIRATLLQPGERMSEKFAVPSPLQPRGPFLDDTAGTKLELPDPVERIVFCVGMIPAASYHDLDPGNHPVVNHGTRAASHQYLPCSDPLNIE